MIVVIQQDHEATWNLFEKFSETSSNSLFGTRRFRYIPTLIVRGHRVYSILQVYASETERVWSGCVLPVMLCPDRTFAEFQTKHRLPVMATTFSKENGPCSALFLRELLATRTPIFLGLAMCWVTQIHGRSVWWQLRSAYPASYTSQHSADLTS